jgi:hypothetical protein
LKLICVVALTVMEISSFTLIGTAEPSQQKRPGYGRFCWQY